MTGKPAPRRIRVLFVDDETDILEAFGMALQLLDAEAVCCANPGQALSRFAEDPGSFDAIITDFSLPQLTCAEFVARLRQIRGDIPVHLCTGNTEQEVTEATDGLGIRSILFKPFDFEALEGFMAAIKARSLRP